MHTGECPGLPQKKRVEGKRQGKVFFEETHLDLLVADFRGETIDHSLEGGEGVEEHVGQLVLHGLAHYGRQRAECVALALQLAIRHLRVRMCAKTGFTQITIIRSLRGMRSACNLPLSTCTCARMPI